jgi:hypothetical protein
MNQQTVWMHRAFNSTGAADTVPPALDVLDISSNGVNIWGITDSMGFVYRRGYGDMKVSASLQSFTGMTSNGKAGLAIRGSLEAGAAHVTISSLRTGMLELIARASQGETSRLIATVQTQFPARPTWLSIERNEAFVTVLLSDDGVLWRHFADVQIALGEHIYGGFVVTSGAGHVTAGARFGHIEVTQR